MGTEQSILYFFLGSGEAIFIFSMLFSSVCRMCHHAVIRESEPQTQTQQTLFVSVLAHCLTLRESFIQNGSMGWGGGVVI